MKNLLLIFALLFPFLLSAQEEWRILEGKEDKFEIAFYGKSNISLDTLQLGDQYLYQKSWISEISDTTHRNYMYGVLSTVYPSSHIHSDSSFSLINGFLNSSINDFIVDDKYELLTSTLEIIDGYPGKEFDIKVLSNGALVIFRSYLIENQLLQLFVMAKENYWFNMDIDNYFSSLKLLDRPQNNVSYGFTVIKEPTYTIKFPSKPTEQNQFIDSQVGQLNMRMKMLERDVQNGDIVFMAAETKYPEGIEIDGDEYLTNAMNGSLNSTNATLIESKKIKYKEFDGIEFYSSLNNGTAISINRFFLINGTAYMQVVYSTEKTKSKEVDKFFKSFEVIKK